MTLVLVHGGGHTSRCWEPTLPYLTAPTVAVDLPGRGRRPGPLDQIRIVDFVNAVVEDLHALDTDQIVLVGHSMAGLTIPGVLERVHELISHVVFVSCAIPPDGGSLLDTLPPDIREFALAAPPSSAGGSQTLDEVRAGQTYDMDEDQARFTVDVVVPEAYWPLREPVDHSGLRQSVPRTWVKLLQDRSFPPDVQDIMAQRARCADMVEVDSGHMVMISHPAELATVLNHVHG
jgi:pimeloyl-ACP methyl ester carboxylesterase